MIHIWVNCLLLRKCCVQSRGYQFEYLEMGKDFTREAVLEEFPEARTFPQIVVGGQKVGGFEQFVKYIEDTNYTGTGYTL